MDMQFKLPITYIVNKELVNKSIIEDLQMQPIIIILYNIYFAQKLNLKRIWYRNGQNITHQIDIF